MNIYHSYAAALLGLCISTATLADKASVDFEANAGLQHDSNLNIKELDTATGTGDTARLLNARVSGRYDATDKLKLKAGYGYASKAYREYDAFDQAIHTFSADASYDFSLVTLGTMYHLADANLASKPFLTLSQRSVYAGRLFNDRFYLRAAFNHKQKHFDNNARRDADGSGVDADLFVFFNGADSFFSIGVVSDEENANSNLFDNDALGFRGRLSNKFVFLGRNNTTQLGWRYLRRDYSSFDPAIGAQRYDIRRTTEASWEIALTPFLSAIGKLKYGNHDSNLDSADYSESLGSLMIKAKF